MTHRFTASVSVGSTDAAACTRSCNDRWLPASMWITHAVQSVLQQSPAKDNQLRYRLLSDRTDSNNSTQLYCDTCIFLALLWYSFLLFLLYMLCVNVLRTCVARLRSLGTYYLSHYIMVYLLVVCLWCVCVCVWRINLIDWLIAAQRAKLLNNRTVQ